MKMKISELKKIIKEVVTEEEYAIRSPGREDLSVELLPSVGEDLPLKVSALIASMSKTYWKDWELIYNILTAAASKVKRDYGTQFASHKEPKKG